MDDRKVNKFYLILEYMKCGDLHEVTKKSDSIIKEQYSLYILESHIHMSWVYIAEDFIIGALMRLFSWFSLTLILILSSFK